MIDYTDPSVIERQNIAPNACCDIGGQFYDVRNLLFIANSQQCHIEALEAQLAKATEVVEASGRKRGELEAKLTKAVDAFSIIDALDPEAMAQGCSQSALIGLVNRMGEAARATIAAIKGEAE